MAEDKKGADKKGSDKKGADKKGADKKSADKKGAKTDKAAGAPAPAGTPKPGKADKPAKGAQASEMAHAADQPHQPARLKEIYRKEVMPALTKQFGYTSQMQVPRISKVVLNMGVGEATADKKILENAVADMTKISGQKPVITKARKAIAGFKIREGYPIGCMVTLRQERMYEFIDRLVTVALPRVRDFRGVSGRGFDGRGNYNMGVKEQIIFPEIEYDKIDAIRGMNISITTTAKTDAEAKALLAAFKFPFRN